MSRERIRDIKMCLILIIIEATTLPEEELGFVLNSNVKVEKNRAGEFAFLASLYFRGIVGHSVTEKEYSSISYVNEVYNWLYDEALSLMPDKSQNVGFISNASENTSDIVEDLIIAVDTKMRSLIDERKNPKSGTSNLVSRKTSDNNRVLVKDYSLYEELIDFEFELKKVQEGSNTIDKVINQVSWDLINSLNLDRSLLARIREYQKEDVLDETLKGNSKNKEMHRVSEKNQEILDAAAAFRNVATLKSINLLAEENPVREQSAYNIVLPIEVSNLKIYQNEIHSNNKLRIAELELEIEELEKRNNDSQVVDSDLDLLKLQLDILKQAKINETLVDASDGMKVRVQDLVSYTDILDALSFKPFKRASKKMVKKKKKVRQKPKRLKAPKRLKPKKSIKERTKDFWDKYGVKTVSGIIVGSLIIGGMANYLEKKLEKKRANSISYEDAVELAAAHDDFMMSESDLLVEEDEDYVAPEPIHYEYNVNDYSFVHLDGNLYLATSKFNPDTHYIEYYNVLNNELVGRYFVGDLSFISSNESASDTYDFGIQTHYGYGSDILKEAVVPLFKYVDAEGFNQEDFLFFTSNSEELKEMFEEKTYCFNFSESDSTMKAKSSQDIPIQSRMLQKFICTYNNDVVEEIIGYRMSNEPSNVGYNFVYDVVTGKIYDLDFHNSNTLFYVSTEDYSYDDNKTLAEIKTESEETIDSNNIMVLDTTNRELFEANKEIEDYYYLIYQETVDNFYIFKDFYNDNAVVKVSQVPDMIIYDDEVNDIHITSTASIPYYSLVLGINDFFENNGFDRYSVEYTKDSLNDDINLLKSNMAMGDLEKSEVRYDSHKDIGIPAQNILVFDTNSESINFLENEHDRYYILVYDGIEDPEYNIWHYVDAINPDASASVDSNLAWLVYNNKETLISAQYVDIDNDYETRDMAVKPINIFLEEQGYSDLINSTYTEEALSSISNYLNEKGITLELTHD